MDLEPGPVLRHYVGMRKGLITLLSIGLAACGCAPARTQDKPDTAKQPESTARTLVEGMTGRAAVTAGQKAKADITRISQDRNQDLNEVLE